MATRTRAASSSSGRSKARPRGPFPHSLGDHVAAWIETNCCHGPGDIYGQTVRLTNEEHAFLEQAYAIDVDTGRRLIDVGVYSRRKGTRKSELGAWLVAAETRGPVRGYLDAGEPVARPPVDPWVLCAATTEDQGELVYGAFRAIVKASDRLASLYDVGLEITYLTDGPGKVTLTQSKNPAALDGGRPTFEVADEFHLWIEHRLREAYATLRRNLRKRHAAQPWLFAPTTAYAPRQRSVAEVLHKACGTKVGQAVVAKVLFDHWQASTKWDLTDPEQLRMAIVEAGRDAFWGDTEAIASDYDAALATGTVAEFRRFWLNQPDTDDGENWLTDTPGAWGACAAELDELPEGAEVVVGVDMALRNDSVGVVLASHHGDRIRWDASVWEAQRGRIDHLEVFEWIASLPEQGLVVRAVTYDPRFFEVPAQMLAEQGFNVVEFPQSPERMTPACELAHQLITGGRIIHDGDPVLAAHVGAAVWRESDRGRTLSKRKASGHIDALIAAVMATRELLHDEPDEDEEEANVW